MSKENISATVDPEVAQYLQREEINTSGKINKLVKQEMSAGTSEKQMLQLRKEQLEGDVADLKSRLETKEEMLENVESRLSQIGEEEKEEAKEMLRKLKRVPNDPEHSFVQEVAEELDMTPEQALEESENL